MTEIEALMKIHDALDGMETCLVVIMALFIFKTVSGWTK
jgi:hypothetical protein